MLQLFQDFLAQHPVALAMDEDDLLPLLLRVLPHHLVELIQLVLEHVTIVHARRIVQQLVDMQVYLHDILLRLAGDGDLGGELRLLALQHLGEGLRRHFALHHAIILHDREEQCVLVEIIVLDEAMQLIELHRVHLHLHVERRFALVGLLLLERHQLHTQDLQVIELILVDLLQQEFRVRLDEASGAGDEHRAVSVRHIIAQVIITIVD